MGQDSRAVPHVRPATVLLAVEPRGLVGQPVARRRRGGRVLGPPTRRVLRNVTGSLPTRGREGPRNVGVADGGVPRAHRDDEEVGESLCVAPPVADLGK